MSSDVTELLGAARELIERRMGAEGLRHARGTENAAAALARVYGVDTGLARLAGLLHDGAKQMSGDQLLREAEERAIPLSEVEREIPYLLHAPVGAALLRDDLPGIPDEVVTAVARHTVGAVDMAPLDMVLFVADMIEEARDFRGVDDLRAKVGHVSLEDLYLAAYVKTISYVISARNHLHPGSVGAYNAAVDAARGAHA